MKPILAALLLAGTSLASPKQSYQCQSTLRTWVPEQFAAGVDGQSIYNAVLVWLNELMAAGLLTADEVNSCALSARIHIYDAQHPRRAPIKSDAQMLQEAIDAQTEAIERLESRIVGDEVRRRSSFHYPTR